MTGQQATAPPVLVPLAAEIDMTTCEQLSASFACGAPAIIAGFTFTSFCDCATLRCLLAIQRQAADRYAQFRGGRFPARTAGSCG